MITQNSKLPFNGKFQEGFKFLQRKNSIFKNILNFK